MIYEDEQNVNVCAAVDDTCVGDHGVMPETHIPEPPAPEPRNLRVAPFWEAGQPSVLIADPHAGADAAVLLEFCQQHGIRTMVEQTGARSLIAYGRNSPDAVVISENIDDVDWSVLAGAIDADSGGGIPVLLVRDQTGEPAAAADDPRIREICSGYNTAVSSPVLARLGRIGHSLYPRTPELELTYGSLVMRPAAFEVRDGGQTVGLTLREFELLRVLMLHKGQAVPLDQLKADVWGAIGETVTTQTLQVHMNRVKHKLTGTVKPVAVRGVGYRLSIL